MTLTFGVHELLEYSAWQRDQWRVRFLQEGASALAVTTGPHGDGRFPTIGALIRHIFSAELRYAERLGGLALTDTSAIPVDDAGALFRFGAASRARLEGLLQTLPAERWDVQAELTLPNRTVRASPRKIVLHVLTHELRHWAQVATLLRLQGRTGAPQDLLLSPVLGDPGGR